MYQRIFSSYIAIVALKSKGKLEQKTPMGEAEGKAFVDGVFHLLEELAAKPLGLALLDDIERAMKPVIIYCDDASGRGSVAIPYPGTMANEMGRFVKIRQIPDIAITAAKKQDPSFLPPSIKSYAALFHRTLETAKANRDIAAAIMGLERSDLDDIELGLKQLPSGAYIRFAMFFYDHLDPGDGCSVALRFDPDQSKGTDTDLIILGHELIHAWRMVRGMRIFSGGWEEEAMTTGIPPFMNMKFTENKLRLEHGLPLRTSYTTLCETAHYQAVSGFDGGKGIWPEHLRAWDEWKNKNPKQAEKKLIVTKKSTFSSPVKTIYGR